MTAGKLCAAAAVGCFASTTLHPIAAVGVAAASTVGVAATEVCVAADEQAVSVIRKRNAE